MSQAETFASNLNPAPAGAPVHDLIRGRWSPRAFSTAPVAPAEIASLLEAARWAPSCMNEQPWEFVLADRYSDPAGFDRIAATLMPANRVWAGQAPVLMIAVARLSFARNGQPNRWALYDTGQAVAQLALEAAARGLAVHQMGGFDVDQARATLGIPDGYEPVAALAIGYPGDPDDLNAELRARELATRRRRPVSEWTHRGHWGDAPENRA